MMYTSNTLSIDPTTPNDATPQSSSMARSGRRFMPAVIAATVGAGILFNLAGARAAELPPSTFADLAEKVTPAVVTITSSHTVERQSQMPDIPFQFPPGSPFEDFFRHFREQQGQGGTEHVRALGCGFITDDVGYDVANRCVGVPL